MAVSLLLDQFFPRTKTAIAAVELDASLSESHEMENKVTAWPVETGAEITDHISTLSDRVVIEGFMTNTPVTSIFEGDRYRRLVDREDRVEEAFRVLRELRDTRALFTIQTGLRLYDSMAITKLIVPVKPETGQAITFTVECQQVSFAASETATVDAIEPIAETVASDDEAQDQAPATVDAGQQSPEETTPESKAWSKVVAGFFGFGN